MKKNTLYILIVHTLFGTKINNFVPVPGLTRGFIYHLIVAVLLNLAGGVAIGIAVYLIKRYVFCFLKKVLNHGSFLHL